MAILVLYALAVATEISLVVLILAACINKIVERCSPLASFSYRKHSNSETKGGKVSGPGGNGDSFVLAIEDLRDVTSRNPCPDYGSAQHFVR